MKNDSYETSLEQVCRTAPIGLCLFDTELRYRYVNEWLASINGLSAEAHIGRTLREVDSHVSAEVESTLRRVLNSGVHVLDGTVEAETPATSNQKRIFQFCCRAVKSDKGAAVGVSCVVQDITERKRVEDELVDANRNLEDRVHARTLELAKSEGEMRHLLESTEVVPWEADAKTWQFTYVGPQAVKLLGYPVDRWYEKNFWRDCIHPEDREFALDYCVRSSQQFEEFDFEYRMVRPDGRVVWVHDVVSVSSIGGIPSTLNGFLIDITERKLAQDAMQAMSGRLIEIQENERSRIARELHDDLSQRLALLAIELERTSQNPPESAKEISLRMQRLLVVASELSTSVHNLSHELHPASLEQLGLIVSVQNYCDTLGEHHDLEIEFVHRDVPDVVAGDVSICLYRIVQESLRNVAKHSGARKAQVALTGNRNTIRLCIADEGVGFEASSIQHSQGLGLVSMRERLRLIGGEMSVESKPSCGTVIDVCVPLSSTIGLDQRST